MPGEVFAGIGAFKTALDIAKGLKDMNDAVARNQAVIDLQQIILDAQRAQQELLSENVTLKEQLRDAKDRTGLLDRYEMIDVKGSGEFAYRLKTEQADGKPRHYVCPACFENGKISTLHASGSSNGQDYYTCHACDKHLTFGRYIESNHRSDYSDF